MRPPPPPPRQRCSGEGRILTEWEGRVKSYARRLPRKTLSRIGWSVEDAEQDLREVLLKAIRKYAAAHHGQLPTGEHGRLLTVVLQRRCHVINRFGRVGFRVVDNAYRASIDPELPPPEWSIEDGTAPVEEVLADQDVTAAAAAVVYALRRNVPPLAFAILHLRVIEGLEPRVIASLTGVESNAVVSRRIAHAKALAREFLSDVGIHEWGDVVPEEAR